MFPTSPCTVSIADIRDAVELGNVVASSFARDIHLNQQAYLKEIRQQFEARLRDPKGFSVYKCMDAEEKILGTATGIWRGYFQSNRGVLPELGTLAVPPEHQRQGIGERLVEAVEKGAKERNFPGMTLCHWDGCDSQHNEVDSGMRRLHRFYERLGYQDLVANGRLQHNQTPRKDKFITPINPNGRCYVSWMVKFFFPEQGVLERVRR